MNLLPIDLRILGLLGAAHLATPLDKAMSVGVRQPGQVAYRKLREASFDQAPVLKGPGKWVGWVATDDLQGADRVEEVLTWIGDSRLVSTDAPMDEVLQALESDGFVFVVGAKGLHGFVTPSDLDRHAARSYFYLLTAAAELLLSALVRQATAEGEIEEAQIEASMGASARKRWDHARAANMDTHPVEYLDLSEIVTVFRTTRFAHAKPGYQALARDFDDVIAVRNRVMHPAKAMLEDRNTKKLARAARSGATVVNWLLATADESTALA